MAPRILTPVGLAVAGAALCAYGRGACAGDACDVDEDTTSALQTRSGGAARSGEGEGTQWWPGPDGIPSAGQLADARKAAETNEELKEPEILKPPYKLRLQETWLPTPWIGGGFMTRGYGSIPGPTIVVKPGELLKITIENGLGKGPGMEACDTSYTNTGFFMNQNMICELNCTNFHTHGLHVSGEGPKQDDVLRKACWGESLEYEIQLPENHMPGTAWYHPHIHHSTASQAGGGAHGMIIVEDPPDYLPKEVQDMPEFSAVMSLVNPVKNMRLEVWGTQSDANGRVAKQVLWKNKKYPGWVWDPVSGPLTEYGIFKIPPQIVVNGQFHPKKTLSSGKWHRMRIVYAAIEQRAELWMQGGDMHGGANCEMQLLAKDSVYLHVAPRAVQKIRLASGSRADVAIRCSCGTGWSKSTCKAELWSMARYQPQSTIGSTDTFADASDKVMSFVVENAMAKNKRHGDSGFNIAKLAARPLPPFEVRRPCYLADLRGADIRAENQHRLHLHAAYPMMIDFDGRGEIWAHHVPPPLAQIPLGAIQEWEVEGMDMHPLHLHVNPYQIQNIGDDGYYMEGDWHDTCLTITTDPVRIRLNPDRFTGKMITHCHILEHEDNGMMAWFNLTGIEGTLAADAALLDRTCYQGAYPGPLPNKNTMVWR